MTQRIEVGQRWQYTGEPGRFFTPGKVYTVTRGLSEGGWFHIEDDATGNHGWQDDADFHQQFEFVVPNEPVLPVRTVTRLEIVPGEYGRVKIQMKKFSLGGLRPCVELTDPHTFITREQLREAARVFVSLAEALEEQSP